MKKIVFAFVLSIICFFTFYLAGNCFAQGQIKPKAPVAPTGISPQQTAPAASEKPASAEGIKKISRAQITNLEIGTDATGTWTWKATVKNTGTATLEGKNMTVQGYCISFPAAQNSWKPASGSIVGQTKIEPNQSVEVTRRWTRCCQTDQLKVELRNNLSNTVWDTKIISNLLFNPANKKPLDVHVKRIDWDNNAKTWKATIKNFTGYTVKITVQGYLWPAGSNSPAPAGGQQLTLEPQGEKVSMALHANTTKNGDLLKVHIFFEMGGGTCGESSEDCGGKGSNNITIPNSATF